MTNPPCQAYLTTAGVEREAARERAYVVDWLWTLFVAILWLVEGAAMAAALLPRVAFVAGLGLVWGGRP